MLLVGEDAAPCFSTDDSGRVLFRNASAMARFGNNAAATLVGVLHKQFASPSAVLFRLQSRAANTGAAREVCGDAAGPSAPCRFIGWRQIVSCGG